MIELIREAVQVLIRRNGMNVGNCLRLKTSTRLRSLRKTGQESNSQALSSNRKKEKLMKSKSIAMICIASTLWGTAHQATALEVRGFRSCGKWISERAASDSSYATTWLVGYMSGIAMGAEIDILAGTDNQSIYLWMDNYCRANPLKDTSDGGVELTIELMKKKSVK